MTVKTSTRAERRQIQEEQRRQKAITSMSIGSTTFIIARHGETDWNLDGRLQGQSLLDPGLNEQGFKQADTLAEGLRTHGITHVFSSDLRRAKETAQAVGSLLHFEVHYDRRLRERNQGVLHNLTYKEAAYTQPEAYAILKQKDVNARLPGGGESQEDIRLRVVEALQDIAAKFPGGKVLIVTHGGVVNEVYRHVTGCSYGKRIMNGSLNVVHVDSGSKVQGSLWAIGFWNSTEHLSSVGFSCHGFGGGVGEA